MKNPIVGGGTLILLHNPLVGSAMLRAQASFITLAALRSNIPLYVSDSAIVTTGVKTIDPSGGTTMVAVLAIFFFALGTMVAARSVDCSLGCSSWASEYVQIPLRAILHT